MSLVLLDDHLLRDVLADEVPAELADLLEAARPATTNHYLYRLCRSVVAAPGGALTGSWTPERRRALGSVLVALPPEVDVVPMRELAFRMAEIAPLHRLSTLGAEAVAAAEHLDAPLCVWSGDDGPQIRAAMGELRCEYVTIDR